MTPARITLELWLVERATARFGSSKLRTQLQSLL
jgi:hypothetical protein